MPRFYFPADYGGFTVDDDGEVFSTTAEAEAHAKIVVTELAPNNSKSVTVFLVSEEGSQLASFAFGCPSEVGNDTLCGVSVCANRRRPDNG
jgi:hypothetical protein